MNWQKPTTYLKNVKEEKNEGKEEGKKEGKELEEEGRPEEERGHGEAEEEVGAQGLLSPLQRPPFPHWVQLC